MPAENENQSAQVSGVPPPTACSAVSPIQSAFLNLKSAQRDCEAAADFLGAMEYGDAVVWINSASDLLASAKAKILASQNPKVHLRELGERKVEPVVGTPNL